MEANNSSVHDNAAVVSSQRLPVNSYSNYGPVWCEEIISDLNGTSFEIGIESDKKRRGSAVNVEVMDYDTKHGLFVLCVRKSDFRPGRFTRTRKDYFLCGRNENGNAFAHPVEVIATNANVRTALCRIWQTTPSVLDKIVRHGDVALIPERSVTYSDVEPFDFAGEFAVGDTHIVRAERVYLHKTDATVYVNGAVQMRHEKHQHPDIATTLPLSKLYRVQLGIRAQTWGFARPTAD